MIANLIKVFFRKLPKQILASVLAEALLECRAEEDALEIYASLPRLEQGMLSWLIDLACAVALREGENRMSAKAVAIVLGPNLFEPDLTVNPMEALMLSQKAVAMLHELIVARLRTEHGVGGEG